MTQAGTDPLKLGIGDRLIAILPNFLQFGYMPGPLDVGQAVPGWVVVTCALTMVMPGPQRAAGGSSARSVTKW